MRLIDADAICFDELKNDFDRARAKTIIIGQPTVDIVTEERCYEIAREMIPQFVRSAKVEAVKTFAKKLRAKKYYGGNSLGYGTWVVEVASINDLEKETVSDAK